MFNATGRLFVCVSLHARHHRKRSCRRSTASCFVRIQIFTRMIMIEDILRHNCMYGRIYRKCHVNRSKSHTTRLKIRWLWHPFTYYLRWIQVAHYLPVTHHTFKGLWANTNLMSRLRVYAPASYTTGHGFESRLANRLSWLRFHVIFLSSPRGISGIVLSNKANLFLPSLFKFHYSRPS
jgi:hypothetical protein